MMEVSVKTWITRESPKNSCRHEASGIRPAALPSAEQGFGGGGGGCFLVGLKKKKGRKGAQGIMGQDLGS